MSKSILALLTHAKSTLSQIDMDSGPDTPNIKTNSRRTVKRKRPKVSALFGLEHKEINYIPPSNSAFTTEDLEIGSHGKPTLIKHISLESHFSSSSEMVWDPIKQEWRGNESVLNVFSSPKLTTKPMLISQMSNPSEHGTKMLIEAMKKTASNLNESFCIATTEQKSLPEMVFDASKRCWVGNDEDADIFADFDVITDVAPVGGAGEFNIDDKLRELFRRNEADHDLELAGWASHSDIITNENHKNVIRLFSMRYLLELVNRDHCWFDDYQSEVESSTSRLSSPSLHKITKTPQDMTNEWGTDLEFDGPLLQLDNNQNKNQQTDLEDDWESVVENTSSKSDEPLSTQTKNSPNSPLKFVPTVPTNNMLSNEIHSNGENNKKAPILITPENFKSFQINNELKTPISCNVLETSKQNESDLDWGSDFDDNDTTFKQKDNSTPFQWKEEPPTVAQQQKQLTPRVKTLNHRKSKSRLRALSPKHASENQNRTQELRIVPKLKLKEKLISDSQLRQAHSAIGLEGLMSMSSQESLLPNIFDDLEQYRLANKHNPTNVSPKAFHHSFREDKLDSSPSEYTETEEVEESDIDDWEDIDFPQTLTLTTFDEKTKLQNEEMFEGIDVSDLPLQLTPTKANNKEEKSSPPQFVLPSSEFNDEEFGEFEEFEEFEEKKTEEGNEEEEEENDSRATLVSLLHLHLASLSIVNTT